MTVRRKLAIACSCKARLSGARGEAYCAARRDECVPQENLQMEWDDDARPRAVVRPGESREAFMRRLVAEIVAWVDSLPPPLGPLKPNEAVIPLGRVRWINRSVAV